MERKKNILLVYPKIPQDTYWSFDRILHFVDKRSSTPPLGLITVAAMLPEDYNLRLVDMNVNHLMDWELNWADAVFTSSMVVQKDSLENVIKRANDTNVPIVAGGPYPTQYFDMIKGHVDHFVLGEAESGVLESFLRDLEKGEAKRVYSRNSIRSNREEKKIDQQMLDSLMRFFSNDSQDIQIAKVRPHMDESPIPRFDLLDMDAYASMAIQMSRGCPYSCDFCNESTLFGHAPRLKSAEKLVSELETILDAGYTGSVFIVDDNFVGNKNKVKNVLQKMKEFQQERGYLLDVYTEADITLANDEELMSLMRDAGFTMVFMGLESPDKEVLRSMGKMHNVKVNLLDSVRKIQSYGMEVSAGFIIGNDNDPPDICDKMFDFCQAAGIPMAMVSLLNAVKGS
ncbi:B12-binding domain-containing radical SAM protein, partial [Candidatus Woesearchaeota archaeon]|nr:B12-binding domain-containing radical SAM protein [Candidatus Woesearchaeota archaeon]